MSTMASLKNAKHILTVADQKGLTTPGCDALIKTGFWADLVEAAEARKLSSVNRDDFRRFIGLPPIKLFIAVVDYGLPLSSMIQLGRYDGVVDSHITTENFLLTGKGKWEVEYEIIYLNRAISFGDSCTEIKIRKLEPAKIEDLLAFGAKYPDIQREFTLFALGSVILNAGNCLVACLDGSDTERNVSLFFWDDHRNDANYRFLAVRNRRQLAA